VTQIRGTMTEYLGMAREAGDLAQAGKELSDAAERVRPGSPAGGASGMLALAARAVVAAATAREESRGCHRRVDYPHRREELRSSICWRLADPTDDHSLQVCSPASVGASVDR
jgi:L-aspartate oxidase